MIKFILSDHAYISLQGNTFHGVNISAGGDAFRRYILEMKNNVFDNNYVSIHGSGSAVSNEGEPSFIRYNNDAYHISGDDIYKWKELKNVEDIVNRESAMELSDLYENTKENQGTLSDIIAFLFKMHNWVRVDPQHISNMPNREESACVILNDNKFSGDLVINMNGYLFLKGENRIKHIKRLECSSHCYLGPYQKIDESGDYAEPHKEIFIKLQEKAIERNDQSQARILQLEIKKCEHHILRREKRTLANLEDLIIMEWGHWISRHSTSWAWPIFWLLGANAILTACIAMCYNDSVGFAMFWLIFIEFINPVSSPLSIFKEAGIDTGPGIFLSFINVFQKVLFAVLVYETIKAFRRFALK